MLVYDITSRESIQYISDWLHRYEYTLADEKILLIGNKCDLEAEREVPRDRGEELARSLGIPFLETSAKTNHNVDESVH
jgi:GTPase SAR1 family protein